MAVPGLCSLSGKRTLTAIRASGKLSSDLREGEPKFLREEWENGSRVGNPARFRHLYNRKRDGKPRYTSSWPPGLACEEGAQALIVT